HPNDWLTDVAANRGWSVAVSEKKVENQIRRVVDVRRDDATVGRIQLGEAQLSARDILPSHPRLQKPLAALAIHEGGEPVIRVYDAVSGVPIRQFTGHLGRIHSLSFDREGRFLVSVAQDQTVSVWSLTDIDQTAGRRGMLRGVALKKSDNGELIVGK